MYCKLNWTADHARAVGPFPWVRLAPELGDWRTYEATQRTHTQPAQPPEERNASSESNGIGSFSFFLCLVFFSLPVFFPSNLSLARSPRIPSSLPLSLSPFPFALPAFVSNSDRLRQAGGMTMRRGVAAALVPPWLEPLLTTHFFAACPYHPDAARNECNMFCVDCGSAARTVSAAAFCFYCRSDRHSSHRVIQIRRSSYHDVVRVAEIQKVLDISNVQTYVINSARVLFLNERPQPRGSGRGYGAATSSATAASAHHTCEICARSLLDPFRFCSLGCKLVGIKRNGDACLELVGGGIGSKEEEEEEGGARGSGEKAVEEKSRGGGSREDVRTASFQPNSRRRKGIPHRAPFFAF